ncbi:hypothetical protein Y032_0907g2981 [Ancylostoma ceylanicum]|uniref:Uncharacterized protein n=1 Tax=Ancylostoma ceylanicum TaxID=53326 RepID=A0A016WAN7_9BILA|nr:hypothetical protein Y032_0907g2981 [Ancylostoma ceylanicum]
MLISIGKCHPLASESRCTSLSLYISTPRLHFSSGLTAQLLRADRAPIFGRPRSWLRPAKFRYRGQPAQLSELLH